MLTIFHTADWHLGQSFYGFDRDFEHRHFLDWLVEELASRRPDALLIAGDIFDSVNPSATAQNRYFNFLAAARGAAPDLQIIITAGNHDAGARLEAPAELLEQLNIRVVGTVTRTDSGDPDVQKFLVPLKNSEGVIQAIVLAVPFLRPSDVPLNVTAADPYLDGIREIYHRTTRAAAGLRDQICPGGALIAMGHCHILGAQESRDSERRLVIGGAEALSANTFPDELSYVALGHLHRSQHCGDRRICYSGSVIPLSFTETDYRHQILSVMFEGTRLAGVEEIPIPRTTSLLTIPKLDSAPIAQVLTQIQDFEFDNTLSPEQQPFLEIRILEEGPDPTRRKRIEEAVADKAVRLASIRVENPLRRQTDVTKQMNAGEPELTSISAEEIFLSAHIERYGRPADESLIVAFREIMLQESRTS